MALRTNAVRVPADRDTRPPAIIGASNAITKVVAEAQKCSQLDCPVLIQGETGTGKELLARLIHGQRGPFIVIDCTHLNSALAESELFGHVRGAYTSADAERSGLIQAANGGTAFFDEIGELSLEVQAKLLRLLQQKTYRRVGSSVELYSDFRVIAATNRDLKQEAQQKRFRQDLYYRLNVAKIRVPALRERKEDIPLLVEHFLRPSGYEATSEALAQLQRYDWPGNVRQLENSLRRMAAQSQSPLLDADLVPATICAPATVPLQPMLRLIASAQSRQREDVGPATAASWAAPSQARLSTEELPSVSELPLLSLYHWERLVILRALEATGGERTRAADLLGIGRTTLYRKMQDMEKEPQYSAALRQWSDPQL